MRFKYQGKTYPEFDSNDMTTDQAEEVEMYTGLRLSEAFDRDMLKSDVKGVKIQLWQVLAQAGENPGPLEDFSYRLGDLDVVLSAKEKRALAGEPADPTTDPLQTDDENPPGETSS